MFGKVPYERIILSYEAKGKGHQKLTGWNSNFHVVMSDDFFRTSKILVPGGNKFLITSHYIFVAKVSEEHG